MIAGVLPAQRGGGREAGRILIFQLLSSLVVLFFDAVRHGRRFAPEAPQRSEDSKSVMASAIIFPSLPDLFFVPAHPEAIRMADGRRRKNVSAMTV